VAASGKSTLAAALAERSGATVISAPDRTGREHDDDWQRNALGALGPVVIHGEPARVPTGRAANDSACI
jgi:hypothetical protein